MIAAAANNDNNARLRGCRHNHVTTSQQPTTRIGTLPLGCYTRAPQLFPHQLFRGTSQREEEKNQNVARWRLLRTLGMGACGIVYLAIMVAPEQEHGRVVAVKSSRPNLEFSLKREKSILKSFLGCEEIVQCIGCQFTMDQNGNLIHNLLMEFAPYGSLGDLIKKKPLLENEARMYTRMLLRGLSRIHEDGIVHCDLKPDNVLLFPSSEHGARYQLKIADFGLSKTKDEKINVDAGKMKFRGTPLYMSPESVMGHIDAPLDIWSLGCIVIEMITGLPALGKLHTIESIMFKLGSLKEAPAMPDGVSQDCKDFLSKCFVTNPSDRWTANMLLNHPFLYPTYDIFRGFQGVQMTSSSFFSYELNCE